MNVLIVWIDHTAIYKNKLNKRTERLSKFLNDKINCLQISKNSLMKINISSLIFFSFRLKFVTCKNNCNR